MASSKIDVGAGIAGILPELIKGYRYRLAAAGWALLITLYARWRRAGADPGASLISSPPLDLVALCAGLGSSVLDALVVILLMGFLYASVSAAQCWLRPEALANQ